MSEDSTKELLEKADQLLEEAKSFKQAPLQVKDLGAQAHRYLTGSALYDLSQKALQQIVKYDDGQCFAAIYLAARCRADRLEKGVEALAPILNFLSAKGLIHSALAPLYALELAVTNLEAPSAVVFCFPLIPVEAHKDVKAMFPRFVQPEGGIGETVDDLRPDLAPGEFQAIVRVTANFLALQGEYNTYKLVQDQIDQYLAVLPKDTVVRSVRQLAVTDLSLPYAVTFYSPLMQDIKRVESDYVRQAAVVDGELKEFNLFTSLKYFNENDDELFKR